MKAYTDIKQSKILAEILSIESADMSYTLDFDSGRYEISTTSYKSWIVPKYAESYKGLNQVIPCWSLAALLDLLPPYLYEFDRGIDLNIYRNLNGKGWHCSYMPNCIENMKKDKFKLITNGDNIVDACVSMIVELKERNLI